MKAQEKKIFIEPEIKVVSDTSGILGYLYEGYREESVKLCEGTNIEELWIYHLIVLLKKRCNDMDENKIHRKLWDIFQCVECKEQFVREAEKWF